MHGVETIQTKYYFFDDQTGVRYSWSKIHNTLTVIFGRDIAVFLCLESSLFSFSRFPLADSLSLSHSLVLSLIYILSLKAAYFLFIVCSDGADTKSFLRLLCYSATNFTKARISPSFTAYDMFSLGPGSVRSSLFCRFLVQSSRPSWRSARGWWLFHLLQEQNCCSFPWYLSVNYYIVFFFWLFSIITLLLF